MLGLTAGVRATISTRDNMQELEIQSLLKTHAPNVFSMPHKQFSGGADWRRCVTRKSWCNSRLFTPKLSGVRRRLCAAVGCRRAIRHWETALSKSRTWAVHRNIAFKKHSKPQKGCCSPTVVIAIRDSRGPRAVDVTEPVGSDGRACPMIRRCAALCVSCGLLWAALRSPEH